jgi:hypothetical protein
MFNFFIFQLKSIQSTIKHRLKMPESKNFRPLIIILALITLAALVTCKMQINDLILNFMTGFFLVFGGVKLLDLRAFADGFQNYDIIARKLKFYGYVYPFIELAFGFLMLAGFHPDWLLFIEVIIMAIGGVGVLIKIYHGEKFNCACLGTLLNVPITYVTLVENFGMAILGLILIAMN